MTLSENSPVRPVLLVLVTAVALLWPAFVNGGPFWFPDTSTYIRGADAGTVFLFDSPSEWSDRLTIADTGDEARSSSAGSAATSSDLSSDIKPTRPVLSGRSVYYGLLIYAPMRLFGPWGAIFLQSLIVAGSIVLCLHIVTRKSEYRIRRWLIALTLAVLTLFTPLPYYTSMLMPDVYSGVLILTLASLMVFWERLTTGERFALLIASTGIATFHTTHLLLVFVIVGIATLIFLPNRTSLRPLLIGVPVVVSSIAAGVLFSSLVSAVLKTEPMSPPFLSARLTAAGPGTEFLRERCTVEADAWELCNHQDKFSEHSDAFLWSEDPTEGVFQTASRLEQKQLAQQDKRFFLAVLADRPLALINVSVTSAARQLISFGMSNFNYSHRRGSEINGQYPPAIANFINTSRAARGTMPTTLIVLSTAIVSLLSLITILLLLVRLISRQRKVTQTVEFVTILLVGVIANAAICGALSGPHDRYQMRLIWLLVVAVGAFFAGNSAVRKKFVNKKTSALSEETV